MKRNAMVLSVLLLSVQLEIANSQNTKVFTWGDQGDGTYKNPILKSDYSDPDILRHGSDFYLIASDFHFVGMQVLHSKDLVNWEIIGQVFDQLGMARKYDQMQGYGEGTWAHPQERNNSLDLAWITEHCARDARGPRKGPLPQ